MKGKTIMVDKKKLLNRINIKSFYETFITFPKGINKVNSMALCPFHDDHHPSLSVNINNGLFNCFACGAKGGLIAFYQRIKNVDFKTALKELDRGIR